MNEAQTMIAAARSAMLHVLDLEAGDRVLVVTDPETRPCGEAFAGAAAEVGCPVRTYALPATGRPLAAAPADLLGLLEETDVVINAIVGDPAEIPFRLQWIRAIEDSGRIRMGHSPGIDRDMMINGPLNIDYREMTAGADRMLGALAGAVGLRVTAPGGTDLVLDVTGRPFVSDLKATVEDGANLPCGEIYCCPVETGADGVLVVDGCYGACGVAPAPVTIRIAGGRVTDIACDHGPTLAAVTGLMDTDAGSRTICELGIGVNPAARMTDRMLEAEKAGGTAHIAFGSNEGMPGGRNVSSMHIDYLFTAPTITATDADRTERVILRDGRVSA